MLVGDAGLFFIWDPNLDLEMTLNTLTPCSTSKVHKQRDLLPDKLWMLMVHSFCTSKLDFTSYLIGADV